MDFFKQHKTLYSIVSAVLAVSLVVYCFGFYSVQAAEISTLPADIDITVSYDAANINWSYSGTDYTFSRAYAYSYNYDGVTYYPRASYPSSMQPPFNLYYTECTYPAFTVESDRQSRFMGASYWFSPSEGALYVLESVVPSDDSAYLSVRGFAKKDGYGCIVFDNWSSSKSYYNVCYRYDFTSGICTLGWVGTGSSNDSRFRTSYNYYDLSSGFTYYGKYNSQSEAYWVNSRNTTLTAYFPVDLLCLYSNYPINGFYEPDTSKVETPDYYMDYQYIFYRKDKGYTFVDSARPLTEVTAQGSYAYLTFAEVCNKYIYTSVDGTAWTLQTDAASMYGNSFTGLNYAWFYDDVTVGAVNQYDAELVYTNDDKFGKPIINPEWADLQDVIDSLPSFTDIDLKYLHKQYFTPSSSFGSYSSLDDALLDLFHGAYTVGNDLEVPMVSNVIQRILSWVTDDVNDWSLSYSDSLLMMLLNEFTSDVSFDYTGTDSEGNMWYEARPSILNYIATISNNVYKMQSYFKNFIIIIDSRLGSIFDNITLTNTHLSGISDKFGKLPDYTASLKDISGKLDKLYSLTPFDDSTLLSSVGSFSSAIDTHFQSLQNQLDNRFSIQGGKLDSILSAIPFSSGSGSFSVDFTELTKSVTEMSESLNKQLKDGFDDIHGDLKYIKTLLTVNTIDNLFDDDDNDDKKGVGTFVTTGISSLASGSVISGALAFTPGVVSAIQGINSIVSRLYTSVPALIPVFTLGPSFYIIDLILRRKK